MHCKAYAGLDSQTATRMRTSEKVSEEIVGLRMKKCMFRLFENLERMPEDRVAIRINNANAEGQRSHGRPRLTLHDQKGYVLSEGKV